MTWDIYIWICLSFMILSLGWPFTAWIINHYNLEVKNKWVCNYFKTSLELNNLPLFLKNEKWKLLIVYYLTAFLTSITYIGYSFLIPNSEYFFIIHMILITVLYLISLTLIIVIFIRFKNKIKSIKFHSKNQTHKYFVDNFQKSEKTQYQNFKLLNQNDGKISVYNSPFQLNQKIFQKKLKKTALNNSASEFEIFLNYLRANANFIHRIYDKKEIIIFVNGKQIALEQLEFILIENFKYMMQNAKK
ncbi:hypothetical protein MENTO_v1c02970 [Mesoplasma entomophilum]|uniref:Transmembrane protein n=1 Tax=Mesoplasma entomophilum TaxID=2149 RepID=A0A3S5XZH9_9MOLU|nr:hypothetical protein [Mesoplasma entomophilum]ATQ35447.1 hypothetical protein CS528_01540 [Mesoplasma entomophilum]ATZ19404.1 hypothetical protein MENTO_v1c02970 [Mesoplasma entomophilum]